MHCWQWRKLHHERSGLGLGLWRHSRPLGLGFYDVTLGHLGHLRFRPFRPFRNKKRIIRFLFFVDWFFSPNFKKTKNGLSVFCFIDDHVFCLISACSENKKRVIRFLFFVDHVFCIFLPVQENKKRVIRFLFFWWLDY